jgi:hypothetical protein
MTSVNPGLPGATGVHMAVAKYETPDSIDKVKAFSQDRIGKEVTKHKERDDEVRPSSGSRWATT